MADKKNDDDQREDGDGVSVFYCNRHLNIC